MSQTKTYDSKCYELAEHFLDGSDAGESERQALASHIQQAIEDWIYSWIEEGKREQTN